MTLISKSVLIFSSENEANRAAALISEALAEEVALVLREEGADWLMECYDNGALASFDNLAELLQNIDLQQKSPPLIEALPMVDWVAETQKGLPPVKAGRFIVHGSHDRASQKPRRFAIEIDAGRAFGTAHHGTTSGCLLAIDRYVSKAHVRRALDLGTGSGVLAIATVKARHHQCQVLAIDIDPIAVAVARQNCVLNGVGAQVRLKVGNGKALSAQSARYDLVTANILARPLIGLAQGIHNAVRVGGLVILSGMLCYQEPEVTAYYLARGFWKLEVLKREGWSTAILQRRV